MHPLMQGTVLVVDALHEPDVTRLYVAEIPPAPERLVRGQRHENTRNQPDAPERRCQTHC